MTGIVSGPTACLNWAAFSTASTALVLVFATILAIALSALMT